MMQTRPFEISDFSGGITDNFIDGKMNQAEEMDNILLTTNKKPISRPGSDVIDATTNQVPNGQQRINALMLYDNSTLLANSLRKMYQYDPAGFITIDGPTGNDAFSDGDANSNTANTFWNDHIFFTNDSYSVPMKIYRDSLSTLQVRNAGLPDLSSTPTIVIGAAGALSYIYGFAFYVKYNTGLREFVDIGPTTQAQISLSSDPGGSANTINGIPSLANGTDNNFDTANIVVKIYRTIGDGNVLYEIGEVANGISTFNDNNADADIQTNATIYTNGGILDNDPPPRCKYVHVTNSIGFYGNIKDDNGNIFSNRILLSVVNDPDSVPNGNIVDVDDEITGVSSFEHIPIVFCKRFIYRLDGFYDEFGDGNPTRQRISDSVGCVSNRSIVPTSFGTFFAGNDGFYWTDSYKVLKISDEFNSRYKDVVNNSSRIDGVYDEKNQRVIWSAKRGASSNDVDSCFVLDLTFGVKPNSCFTTFSGGVNFAPTSVIIFNDEFVRGDYRGYLFRHDENILTDKIVDTLSAPSTWDETTLIWDYQSCSFNFGTTFMRKWVTRINVILQNETNLSLAIFSNNDDGRRISELAPIRFRGNVTWGDDDVVWGDSSVIWNYDGFIDEFRRFPAKGLRCNFKKIQITNAIVITHNSDAYGDATVDNIAKTAVLTDDWPSTVKSYQIFFESDNYTRGYDITSVSTNTIVYSDADDNSPNGTQKWVIKGKPKGEALSLISLCMHYAVMGKTQEGFRQSGVGNNA